LNSTRKRKKWAGARFAGRYHNIRFFVSMHYSFGYGTGAPACLATTRPVLVPKAGD
jgi:hypothetical protein